MADAEADRREDQRRWLERWMQAASRDGAMSQRRRASIESHGGGLGAAAAAARAAGVHLVLLTDNKGDELVAASRHPFKVIVQARTTAKSAEAPRSQELPLRQSTIERAEVRIGPCRSSIFDGHASWSNRASARTSGMPQKRASNPSSAD